MDRIVNEDESDIVAAARDMVAMWRNLEVSGLSRKERNDAIQDVKKRLVEAVDDFENVYWLKQ